MTESTVAAVALAAAAFSVLLFAAGFVAGFGLGRASAVKDWVEGSIDRVLAKLDKNEILACELYLGLTEAGGDDDQGEEDPDSPVDPVFSRYFDN